MSPLSLRRYRAERLLRQEFEGLRAKVLATVSRRLALRGVALDVGDLEACYAQAWQGLYAAVLQGQEIANPTGWLVLVTYRRAIEDYRSSHPERRAEDIEADQQARETDLASQLDDQRRLREIFEGLRERLSPRECQAASLCYLQGLSRAEAAVQMGISETRMRKLMEGNGAGQPGVAGKMGELLTIIRTNGWCEERASLMRAYAFGILDPEGERYKLAIVHQRECPACRAYVASLRGLAAILPPLLLRGGLTAGVAGAGAGVGGGALSGAGAGGVSGASGGWLLAGGSLGAKFASCLAVLGIGAGCLALVTVHKHGALHKTPSLDIADRSAALVRQTLFSTVSDATPFTIGAPRQAHRSSPSRRKRNAGPRRSMSSHQPGNLLAAAAEFGPEHPRSESEVTQPITTSAPAPSPTTTGTSRSSTSSSSSSSSSTANSEFGFEAQGK
jgi:RNA polymerase sigma factor (sigma-70 family)